jgi:hypothetical protein
LFKNATNLSNIHLSSIIFAVVRVKRARRRNLIVKCCGRSSCSDVSKRKSQDRQKKQDETEFVNDLQYNKPKKKRKKSGAILKNLHAFGVFTDQGIHISCAGCPIGWPEMLTVYPEYEVGIPVTCSNCPNNWPGALNLLGIGGDKSWQQSVGGAAVGAQGGNAFSAFDANSNFGADFGNSFGGDENDTPPSRNESKTEETTEASTETTTEFILPEDMTTTTTKDGEAGKGVVPLFYFNLF